MKTNLLKILSVFVAAVMLIGCKGSNTPDAPTTDESTIKSTSSVNGGGVIIIEAIMKDGTRQYYKVISPSEVGVTSYYAYYASKGFQEYEYKGKVVIPESITHDGSTYSVTKVLGQPSEYNDLCSAFSFCKHLKSITLPRTITEINSIELCHWNCYERGVLTELEELICYAQEPPVSSNAGPWGPTPVGDYSKVCDISIKVPAQSVEAYKDASDWKRFADNISAIE